MPFASTWSAYSTGPEQPRSTLCAPPAAQVFAIQPERVKRHEHITERQKAELRRQAQENGWRVTEETKPGEMAEVHLPGELEFISSDQALRTATKVAFSTLGFRAGCQFAQGEAFRDAREYIRTGAPRMATLFSSGWLFDAAAQGPHQHSIILGGRNDTKRVDAIVRFFGALCYLVELAHDYDGADFYNTLVFDAQRGEENGLLVTDMQTEFGQIEHVKAAPDTIWNDTARCGEMFVAAFEKAILAKQPQKTNLL